MVLHYTNMLDLGVWMSIQNLVEKTHKGKKNVTTSLVKERHEFGALKNFCAGVCR